MNNPPEKIYSELDKDFETAVAMLRAGIKKDGVTLSKRDCEILVMRLKTSVDIETLVTTIHELIRKTLVIWSEKS